MKYTLYATIGLPGSGKETWAKTQGLPVIDVEVIKDQLTPLNQRSKKEAEVLNDVQRLIHSLFISGNPVVILLAENLTQKDREFWKNDSEWQTNFREFYITEQEAIRAAIQAGASKTILDQIKAKAKAYEPLSPSLPK